MFSMENRHKTKCINLSLNQVWSNFFEMQNSSIFIFVISIFFNFILFILQYFLKTLVNYNFFF